MRYRVRTIIADGALIGAFAEFAPGNVEAVLLRDYFLELPHGRNWRRPLSLESAGVDDLEPEEQSAHRAITVMDISWTDNLDPIPVIGAEPTVAERIGRYRSVRNWLRDKAAT